MRNCSHRMHALTGIAKLALQCQWSVIVIGMLQGVPGQGLSESVRKYRQSVFKLNYKIKKRLAAPAEEPAPAPGAPPAMPGIARIAASDSQIVSPSASEWWLRPDASPRGRAHISDAGQANEAALGVSEPVNDDGAKELKRIKLESSEQPQCSSGACAWLLETSIPTHRDVLAEGNPSA